MTKTITLELTPYQEDMLLEAIKTEVRRWDNVKTEILLGDRPNASLEGVEMLLGDAKEIQGKVEAKVRKY